MRLCAGYTFYDLSAVELEDEVVGNLIKEAPEINGCAPFIPLSHYTLAMPNGLVLALSFTETKVGVCELWVKYLHKYQVDALTHHSIHYYRYSRFPQLGSAFFWNQGSSCRFKTVGDRLELLMDKREEFIGSPLKFCYRHSVYSRCPSIFLYLLPCCMQSSRVVDSL